MTIDPIAISVDASTEDAEELLRHRREATVVRITSDGRMSTCEISRGWLRKPPFLAHVVRAIGDQERVLILDPSSGTSPGWVRL